jgi:predicted nucleic acid-binding protein
MNVIANTTIISNLASVGRLDLLHDLLGTVYISTDVYGEIQDGLAESCDFYTGIESIVHPLSPSGWLRLTAPSGNDELRLLGQLPSALHRGEASCLAIAIQRGWAFLTDDARARRAAQERGLDTSGTLGVLLQCIKNKRLSVEEADSLLEQMILGGYRSPYGSLIELLE